MTMTLPGVLQDGALTGPECQCGCGEYLPPGSTRQYKKRHSPKYRSEYGNYQGSNNGGRPHTSGPTLAEVADPDSDWLTLADAASSTPNDPDPPEAHEQRPHIRVTKRVRDDIEGKVAMMVMMSAMLLSTKDAICGKALEDNGPNIAAKFVPIICKSPELVRWFTKGGNYTAWLDLVMALWPVLTVAFSHHVSHSVTDDGKANLSVVPNTAYKL